MVISMSIVIGFKCSCQNTSNIVHVHIIMSLLQFQLNYFLFLFTLINL